MPTDDHCRRGQITCSFGSYFSKSGFYTNVYAGSLTLRSYSSSRKVARLLMISYEKVWSSISMSMKKTTRILRSTKRTLYLLRLTSRSNRSHFWGQWLVLFPIRITTNLRVTHTNVLWVNKLSGPSDTTSSIESTHYYIFPSIHNSRWLKLRP